MNVYIKSAAVLLMSSTAVMAESLGDFTAGSANFTGGVTANSGLIIDDFQVLGELRAYDILDVGTIEITGNSDDAGSEGVIIRSNASADNLVGARIEVTSNVIDKGTVNIVGHTTVTQGNVTIGANNNYTDILSSDIQIGSGAYATTVQVGGGSAVSVVSQAGNAEVVLGQEGEGRWIADANGQLTWTVDNTSGDTAAIVMTNDQGNTHGLVVENDKTTLSGGLNSSSLTLNDNGATFSDSSTGAPIQVHGVADGTAPFDAVNVRQLHGGLAAVLASAPDIRLEPGKTGVGVGLGSYGGYTGIGIGMGFMSENGLVVTGSVSKAQTSEAAYRASVSYTW